MRQRRGGVETMDSMGNGSRRGVLACAVAAVAVTAVACVAAGLGGLAVDGDARAADTAVNGEILLNGGGDVLAVHEDGSGLRNLTGESPGVDALDLHGAASPDGLRVAFFSNRDGLPTEPKGVPEMWLYVMNADGSGVRKVVDEPLQATHAAAWSPDGRRLALADNHAVSVVDVGSGRRRTVATGEIFASDAPSWSPDGSTLAYAAYGSPEGFVDVFAAPADGSGAPEDLTAGSPAIDRSPAWLPSQGRIAYLSYTKGTGFPDNDLDARSMRADGSERRDFPPAVGEALRQVESWAFSPDGERISYSTGAEAGARVMDADGTGQRRVADAQAVSDWAPAPPEDPPAPARNARPSIANLRPAPGSTTLDRTPAVTATVGDAETDLAKADMRAYLDGKRVPDRRISYDPRSDRLRFAPAPRLSRGAHSARVEATDERGLKGVRAWGFRIR